MLNCSCSSSSEGWLTATVEGYFTGETDFYGRIMVKDAHTPSFSALRGVELNETIAEKAKASSNRFLYAALHRIIKY
jgi:hypothetical protein